jgi:hypothetical protein
MRCCLQLRLQADLIIHDERIPATAAVTREPYLLDFESFQREIDSSGPRTELHICSDGHGHILLFLGTFFIVVTRIFMAGQIWRTKV